MTKKILFTMLLLSGLNISTSSMGSGSNPPPQKRTKHNKPTVASLKTKIEKIKANLNEEILFLGNSLQEHLNRTEGIANQNYNTIQSLKAQISKIIAEISMIRKNTDYINETRRTFTNHINKTIEIGNNRSALINKTIEFGNKARKELHQTIMETIEFGNKTRKELHQTIIAQKELSEKQQQQIDAQQIQIKILMDKLNLNK